MYLRREVDRANHRGLVQLLGQIARRHTILTRRRYYAQWAPRDQWEEQACRHSFDAVPFVRAQDPLDDHLDPSVVSADIAHLKRETRLVHDYIEQTIAHRSDGTPDMVSFEAFHAAIDAVTPIFIKYYSRITLESIAQLTPVPQFNTYTPFTFPWDVTCLALWNECRGAKTLPWMEIRRVYAQPEPPAPATGA